MAESSEQLETVRQIEAMDRQEVVDALLNFSGSVTLDFTPEFLADLSLAQLRHILVAAKMHISPVGV